MIPPISEPRRRFVDVADGQVHYWEAGRADGRPLLMLHASPGSARMLRPLMRALAPQRRVIALDTRGNGDSSALAAPAPEIPDFARATLDAATALGLDRFDLYGTHTGASIATEAALIAPERISHLILESMGLWDASRQAVHLERNAPDVAPDLIGTQFHWAWNYVRDQHLFWPWYERTAEARLARGLPEAAALHDEVVEVLKALTTYHRSYKAAARYPKRERLARLAVPTLVASAESDALHRYLDEMHALVKSSRRVLLRELETPAGLAEASRAYGAFLGEA
ncbi:MAG: alpha/beta fold hydrolase [Alphaproteobacteria bacterium]|nr:alpha/beta fold hydrolase [Alphaproteobacteria bacterium]